MVYFDVSKEWVVLLPPGLPGVEKAAGDLARYIGLLAALAENRHSAGGNSPAVPVIDASGPVPSDDAPIIALNSEGFGPEQNGFTWRAGQDRVEIFGESGRGLCNGIYSFLAALGISWPAPGEEKLPSRAAKTPSGFPLSTNSAYEPSGGEGKDPAAAPWRRYVPAGGGTIKRILKKSEAFAAWAARQRYDALIFPLTAFVSGNNGRKLQDLKQAAGEYGITLEAGGWDLSTLVPRKYFFFHRDFFRMEGGRRRKDHHFCPTSPGTIHLMGREGGRLFQAAEGIQVFHLWPDKGAETAWCSCPTCRAFSPSEQNRIGVNAAADVLAAHDPGASITYYEKAGEGGNIPLRKNLFRMEKLPEEKEIREL